MSPLELVLERIEGVRRSGAGFSARCPAHEDRHASLSVSEGEDGRALIRCHAGCTAEDVCAALGLDVAELFPREERTNGRAIVARYPYVDEEGGLLFEAVRFSPKDFRQRRPDGHGGWEWRLEGTRRVLYRLPELLAAVARGETVYVVEGEKDVQALERVGLVATCNPMGAGKWRPEYAETLRGAARVVVIPDADEPGRRHAAEVASSVATAGVDVRVVDLAPESSDGFDPSDYLKAATTDAEREQARGLLEQLAETAEGVQVETRGRNSANGAEGSQTDEKRAFSIEVLTARQLCDEPDPDRSDELLGPLVVRGCRTIIGGHTGEGKSTYTTALVAAIVKGEPFLEWQGAGGRALVLDLEQGLRSVENFL
ncbi:MAG: AAA family ATPase, partial [Gaiellaceae bacterium]